jgi:hypothetical protein
LIERPAAKHNDMDDNWFNGLDIVQQALAVRLALVENLYSALDGLDILGAHRQHPIRMIRVWGLATDIFVLIASLILSMMECIQDNPHFPQLFTFITSLFTSHTTTCTFIFIFLSNWDSCECLVPIFDHSHLTF